MIYVWLYFSDVTVKLKNVRYRNVLFEDCSLKWKKVRFCVFMRDYVDIYIIYGSEIAEITDMWLADWIDNNIIRADVWNDLNCIEKMIW